MSTAFISHPDCLLHDLGAQHPETAARLKSIERALTETGLDKKLLFYQAPAATRKQLLEVHSADYIDHIFNADTTKNIVWLDPDTGMNQYTLIAALHAAGAAVYAVDLIMNKTIQRAFCNVRPPGHHAEKNKAMGFCIFNNIAVAAAHALKHYNFKRIAIIDFDAHHGNGTESIFLNENRVLYCSSFQYPFYPFGGDTVKSDHIMNIPLPAGTNGVTFRNEVERVWLDQIKNFKPEILFISAGFDGYLHDDMSDLWLRPADYGWITEKLKLIADHYCQGKIVSVLEGGYALNGLGDCAAAHIKALL